MATERGSLGVGQRLVLLGAWLVSCGFVYVLGFYVGKGMRGDEQLSPRVVLPVDAAIPPAPPPEAQGPLTFYDVLGSREGTPPGAPTAQPAAVTEEKLPPAGAPQTPEPVARPTAAPRVAATPPPPPPPATRAAPASPAAAPPRADHASVPAAPPAPAVPAAAPPVAPPATPTVSPPAVAAAPVAPALPPQSPNGRWTVYASPTRDQLAVQHERAALRAKGYPAEVVTMRRDGDTWYRIRVGRYATEAQADEASRRLRSEGVGHGAFVQSE
jgi:hypothetical protein